MVETIVHKEAVKNWKKRNPEKVKLYGRISRQRYRQQHPEKCKAESRKYYEKHKEKLKLNQKIKRDLMVKKINEIKMRNGCEICGYKRCSNALCFHHKPNEIKKFVISEWRDKGRNWSEMLKEMDKCLILCLNCHQEIHSKLKKYGNNKNSKMS